ncbi:uncharacterized protein LOC133814324 [Humulus lupulus]|uniref:uncharacterized protein LOC133814324 n=1 Tax=Humulus lupulus TaxID=3486 RepID=UPI002B4166B0|nr:uncharacterized protein LOC133814324 [Humulus lupulus]
MHTNGASNSQGAGISVVLEAPSGLQVEAIIRLEQHATNNEAKYEALIYGLELTRSMGIRRLRIRGDLKLMIEQVAGNFDTKAPHLTNLLENVSALKSQFQQFEIVQIPRELNQRVDALTKQASVGECSRHSAISTNRTPEVVTIFSISPEPECWMDPIIRYLTKSKLPSNAKDAKLLRLKAQRYSIIHGTLYRRSFNGPYLRCLRPSKAKKLLEEIHKGACGKHTGGRSLAHKALTVGYYWQYMMTEVRDYAKKCDRCQRFAPTIHQPAQILHSTIAPWPFAKWGLDVVGEFPRVTGGKRYTLLATKYFTKWVVAEAYVTVSKTDTMSFIWKHIICDSKGQAEASNKVIFANIRKNLEDKKGAWGDELPKVLWAYRMTKRTSTGKSPYAMVYGT